MKQIALCIKSNYHIGTLDFNGSLDGIPTLPPNFPLLNTNLYGSAVTSKFLESLNIPDLGYVECEEGFRIYNKSKQLYRKLSLPICINNHGELAVTDKSYTFSFPTEEALEASYKIRSLVHDKCYELLCKSEIDNITKLVDEGNGIAYINGFEYTQDISRLIRFNKDLIKLFSHEQHYIIAKISSIPNLTLAVPEEIIPMVIGKKGANMKAMARKIKAGYIKIVSL